jgi:hypothetical protein
VSMSVAGDNIVPIDVISTNSIHWEHKMNWIGKWKNQYGSILEISDDSDNRIVGTFRIALEDSGFFGRRSRLLAFTRVHVLVSREEGEQRLETQLFPIPGCCATDE